MSTLDDPYRLPSFFAAFNTVEFHQGIGVGKDTCRHLKAHTVFSQIIGRFGRIPFKARLHTNMLLHVCSFSVTTACEVMQMAVATPFPIQVG
jgi:hypothetical protein